jgi:hypothetical protein
VFQVKLGSKSIDGQQAALMNGEASAYFSAQTYATLLKLNGLVSQQNDLLKTINQTNTATNNLKQPATQPPPNPGFIQTSRKRRP